MKNNQVLIGEIKVLENGVMTVETEYSEDDFTIDWSDVKSMKTETDFIIMLSHKYRFNGTISPDPNNEDYLIIYPDQGSKMFAKSLDIVYLKSLEAGFWDRVSANIDAGFSLTKASNTKQVTVSGAVSYLYTRLNIDSYINTLYNVVQDTIATSRNNYGANIKVFFNRSWYILGASDFLKSDEQNLALRTTIQSGAGRNIVRNHKMYLVSAVGFALNTERYDHEEQVSEQSIETFGEVELNIYGIKNVRLSSKFQYFASITEENRNRVNLTLDSKFDLPKDFYIGGNITYNFDSKDDTEGAKSDYVVKSTVGWSF
ncbi:DUF481 domain-containing protein [Reichenbachiella carrageenanivorans]|uniref:DUF481 domain-containing protein n=1 Tax=Reichenbachiella carrageenanivorans TaxID=2979869 RepID=A0ABY6D318_9BACT|nr:DUF481 domain-containing protein [Reichenbachiella carrageenanivorans]UXX78230.1 DUF481 domain-containing protein [Reichenbachiella carrageenanivorans]